jgi:hypothetical protein
MKSLVEQVNFENIGFLKMSFTDTELAPIRAEVAKISKDFEHSKKYNQKLAGNIKNSYLLTECVKHTHNLMAPMVLLFDERFNRYVTQNSIAPESSPIYLKELWVNFQHKHEFNPPHDHYGIISFVIWLKVPFTFEQEAKVSPGHGSGKDLSGRFCFQYTNSLGDICNHFIDADKSLENHGLVFSAKMKHSVFPFYSSDDYRVSVAGNFAIKGAHDK